jgi:hypothetical protein
MSVKPAQVRYLESGKSLGAAVHKGWAATWNWILSFVVGFTGGRGCKLENADNGHPRLDVLIEAGDGCSVTGGEDGKPYVISLIGGGGEGGGDGGGEAPEEPEDPDYPDTPEITAEDLPDGTHIYVDGADIATIPHGKTPEITASKSGKTTIIYADGVPIATIQDGADGEDGAASGGTELTVITGISFSLYQGELVATLSKSKVKALSATDLGTSTAKVCDVSEVTVVTSESYSTSSHQFTNERSTIKVLGETPTNGQTPFTATSLAEE